MADATALARDVGSWAGSWSEDATLEVIFHVSDLLQSSDFDLAFFDAVPRVLAMAWRTGSVEMQVQNGGYYQYFWNGYSPVARVTADDLDTMAQ